MSMRARAIDRPRSCLRRLLSLTALTGLITSWAPGAQGAATPVAFDLYIYGNANVPTIAVANYSRIAIRRFELTIGNFDRSWDFANNFRGSVSDSAVRVDSPDRVDGGRWADTIDFTVTGGGLPPGGWLYFDADVDADRSNAALDYRRVLFNNGQDRPNATAKVTLVNGQSAMITLPDGAADLHLYHFQSEARPRVLEVESVAELAGGDDRVSRVTVTIDGVVPEILGQPGVLAENIGARVRIRTFDGEKVAISAPREVYKNIYGDDITDSVQNDPKAIEDEAEERFTAIGLSVNDVAQSGDPTFYSFDVEKDTSVVVKWAHEYALTVEHDFARTESQERDEVGNPWAGPLSSAGEGNPQPMAKKNWFRRGETVVAQVDGQVLDFSRAGLDIRYVPIGYVAAGPPNRTTNPSDDLATRAGRLIAAQILDADGLTRKLRDSPADPVSAFLWNVFAGPAKTILENDARSAEWADVLVAQLDVVLRGASIWDATRFAGVVLRPETEALVAAGPSGALVTRVNRLLLEDAYPDELERVRVSERFFPFAVRQSQPQRQQVPQFAMYGPGRVRHVWQIQYGVRVNVDDPTRAALARVYQVTGGTAVEIGGGEGTFWFDPGASVRVLTAARENGGTGLALRGWFNGDGHYFSTQGDVDSENGSLTLGGPAIRNDGGAVANWMPSFTDPTTSRLYRGLEIPQLMRAARVFWRYDRQALTIRATIGEFVFQSQPALAAQFSTQPDFLEFRSVTGRNRNVGVEQMTVWDPVASRLYPLVPGRFVAKWRTAPGSPDTMDVTVDAAYPATPHYPHVGGTPPVALDPDPGDNFVFKEIRYTENDASVDGQKGFTATTEGRTVLLFGELQRDGRGEPREFLRVRVVHTRDWESVLTTGSAIIGQKVQDPAADRARLGTGYVYDPRERARYNPFVYDASKLERLAARDVYDMAALRSDRAEKIVVNPGSLPGPIIPVNLFPGAAKDEKLVVIWYDDPAQNDLLLWPHRAVVYNPRWPATAAEGLGRIVIASQFGSDGLDPVTGADQEVVPAFGDAPRETSYNPSRLQQVQIYSQPDRTRPGYNPNEEHGVVAPSLRFANVSPRPPAVYALRKNDLNQYRIALAESAQDPATYTSHPRVLVQFFDTADQEFKMRVYEVEAEDALYRFANRTVVRPARRGDPVPASVSSLNNQPHVRMEAGEPVIPFYPLGEVIGASPCAETDGANLKEQLAYWEDHRGSSWSVSGGSNAWFTVAFFYPLAPDFWWPADKPGVLTQSIQGQAVVRRATVPETGDCVAFVPDDLSGLLSKTPNAVVDPASADGLGARPVDVLYKSDWPRNVPVLKAGETLTFAGGEFRADNPFRSVDGRLVETEGLPGVVAFASAEVVYDSSNPRGTLEGWRTQWTARVAQVLDRRSTALSLAEFPTVLQPATGRSRVKGGRYVFNELPSSLQRRVTYDPLAGQLEIIGLLNDKDIGDRTLTAAPPAVYVLEPNILTTDERDALLRLDGEGTVTAWDRAVNDLYKLSRNPSLVASQHSFFLAPPTNDVTRGAWQTRLERFWRHYYFGVLPRPNASESGLSQLTTALAALPTVTGLRATDPVPTPIPIGAADEGYLVGLEPRRVFDADGRPVTVTEVEPPGDPDRPPTEFPRSVFDPKQPVPLRAFGPGLALVPNGDFLRPGPTLRGPGYVAVVENNDPSLGGSPITVHIIQVDPNERYRGAIKTVESDNVFDENLVLRHTGDFGANAGALAFEWWYRFDDGSLNVPPPDRLSPGTPNPWKLFPDPTGNRGVGRYQITLAGNPNAPEALLADSFWFARYRHTNDVIEGTNWRRPQPDGSPQVNFEWAGAGNSDPRSGDYRAQLAQGWIKRVLDAVNPYEARIRDFEGDHPSTVASMIAQFGQPFVGPVALNPAQNVIENVGLIELYETILRRGRQLSIDLTRPVSTPAIANALQLASTRISDFYTILGNEAYADALDPTIGFGSDSVEYGTLAPAVFTFQNQVSSLIEEELALLRGMDDFFARPVYNRLFWNFTKGEGEAAYAMNYNVSDVNGDGFIDEDDAMLMYPQGHGDAWGHYLTALRNQYRLLRHDFFNWVSRSEFYNLQDIVLKVDFLDERKFAQTAAARAKAGAEIVNLTYRSRYVEDPSAQWQGYTDSNAERAWGVQEWARRAGQGAFFDWVTANALLPSVHPNEQLEGIQKVDRTTNPDIAVVSANLNAVQATFEQANSGFNPLGLPGTTVPFDINAAQIDDLVFGMTHFEQINDRVEIVMESATAVWDNANLPANMLRQIGNSELEMRNAVFQEDLTYRNELIRIFGKPYEGTIGPGRLYPAGYDGPDLLLYMYVDVRQINDATVPGPTTDFATFTGDELTGGDIYRAFSRGQGSGSAPRGTLSDIGRPDVVTLQGYLGDSVRRLFAPTFTPDSSNRGVMARSGLYAVNYTDLDSPKVPLENLTQLMPVTASGYTFQAPREWGARRAAGELQLLINQMIQQEAQVASAIGAWDGLQGEIVREIRFINAKLDMAANVRLKNEIFTRLKLALHGTLAASAGVKAVLESAENTVTKTVSGAVQAIPKVGPTAGLAVSPGDVLAPLQGGLITGSVAVTEGISAVLKGLQIAELVLGFAFDITENELQLFEQREADALDAKEMLKGLENLVGDEPIRRIEIFKEIQTLRELSDQYRALVDQGTRLIDERAAFNKRVAAATQRNRYQDMTFRVSRNHALQTYRSMFDLSARYAYLLAKAYDYETNFDPTHPGSPGAVIQDIVRARSLGQLDHAVTWLQTQYRLQKGQLGIINPILETTELSLRRELYRILDEPPEDEEEEVEDPDEVWRRTLERARVPDLWQVSEFRNHCRPFAAAYDALGQPVAEPGLVLRFSSQILAGRNFFGNPLTAGDHAFDPSVFATRIGGVGVGFVGYEGEDLTSHLPATPRVYLIPVGADVMSVPSSVDPNVVRVWNVLDASIPVPLPARTADLDRSAWIPLLDSLNGRLGEPRRFSAFRVSQFASDDGGSTEIQDRRLIGRSVWNTQWVLIIPGRALHADGEVGLDRLIDNVSDLRLALQTYGHSGN
ncbi:MAG: hypothetical protein KF833_10115 [Verrucomicrobiae bacterium]|nr:hypothetical protein [Verrucomicrobiae bacterium]